MITDNIMGIAFSFLEKILDKLPVMNLDVDFSVLNGFLDVLGFALYFFPWAKVVPILAIISVLQVWRILVSIIRDDLGSAPARIAVLQFRCSMVNSAGDL